MNHGVTYFPFDLSAKLIIVFCIYELHFHLIDIWHPMEQIVEDLKELKRSMIAWFAIALRGLQLGNLESHWHPHSFQEHVY